MPAAKITPTDSTNAEGPKEVPNPTCISWRRSDRLLRGWITGTLSEEVLGIVVGLTTSREVWDALEEAYAQDSQKREFNLTQAMTTLRKGLGQGYENFVTTTLKPPVPPYQEVVSLLKSHETRNQIHGFDSYNHPQVAFYGQRTNGNQNKRKGNGFNKFKLKRKRNVGSNFTRNQPNNFNKQKAEAQNPIMESAVKCQICGKLNHIAMKCFNRFNHSYQEDDIPKALATITIDDNQELEWHPGTGAFVHMTGNSSKLNNLKPYHGQDAVMVGDYKKNKLEPKSLPCIFIGYSTKHKGYKCLYPPTNRIYISRHVVFDESCLPFTNLTLLYATPDVETEVTTFHPWITADENSLSTAGDGEKQSCSIPCVAPTIEQGKLDCSEESNLNDSREILDSRAQAIEINDHQPNEELDSHLVNSIRSIDNHHQNDDLVQINDGHENGNLMQNLPTNSGVDANTTNEENHSPTSVEIVNPLSVQAANTRQYQMVTRSQKGILKPNPRYANLHILHKISSIPIEPKSVRSALKHQGWTIAMHEELEALAKNDTWDLVPRMKDMNVVGSKWVFKTKLHADGSLERLKARLVAKGFHQIADVDFSETFSPVVKARTIHTILAIATTKQWQIRQLDVKNAFLHGYLNEPVYMEQPPGFLDPKFPTHVCRLKRALYELKQAPRDNSEFLKLFISQLGQEFAIKDLGRLNFFLGIEVHYTSFGLILSQSKYALDILSRAQMEDCNSISTPMALKAHSSHSSNDAFHDPTHYRSTFMNCPTIGNYQTVKQILRYVHGTLNYGLQILNHSSLDLYAFSDADWAGCPLTRCSTSGYYTFLGSNCISWCAKKQPTVARSSAKAEYRSMASTTAEITWLAHLLRDIGVALNNAPILHCDNLSAIYMTVNPVFHSRTKYVEIDYHFVREKVALGHLITRFVSSTSQLADIFTKPLTRDSFHRLRSKLGLVSLPLPNLRGSNKVSTCEDHFVEPAEGNKSNGNNALEEN
ncbi:hypothetical protein SLEP1_g53521 [Rubroshorea leprosula]|uniref:Reverse transcriptase Ty1/copia-type domain-containing protein n=1 Tax=Rubroshorea leprosula TaxID=152421 RepID=A0AAV5MCG2_9ROSI|nr:hypothetical protein SLEP1_g53521 [Rubroshorea leprosula]